VCSVIGDTTKNNVYLSVNTGLAFRVLWKHVVHVVPSRAFLLTNLISYKGTKYSGFLKIYGVGPLALWRTYPSLLHSLLSTKNHSTHKTSHWLRPWINSDPVFQHQFNPSIFIYISQVLSSFNIFATKFDIRSQYSDATIFQDLTTLVIFDATYTFLHYVIFSIYILTQNATVLTSSKLQLWPVR
jgi:hypothetical protein